MHESGWLRQRIGQTTTGIGMADKLVEYNRAVAIPFVYMLLSLPKLFCGFHYPCS